MKKKPNKTNARPIFHSKNLPFWTFSSKDRFMTTQMWTHYLFVYSADFYRGILMRSYTESDRLNNNQCWSNCEVQYSINNFWIILIAYFVQSIIFWVNLNFMKIINDIWNFNFTELRSFSPKIFKSNVHWLLRKLTFTENSNCHAIFTRPKNSNSRSMNLRCP